MKLTIVEKNLLSWTAMHIDFVMCKKGDLFGFFEIHCVAKYRKKRRGDPLVESEKLQKKLHCAEKSPSEKHQRGTSYVFEVLYVMFLFWTRFWRFE